MYLDLGPATRRLVRITNNDEYDKCLSEHRYLGQFDKTLYSLANQQEQNFFNGIAGLIDWHKSIEQDLIDDELLSSVPENLRKITAKDEPRQSRIYKS